MRDGVSRVRMNSFAIGQCAVAAAIAWVIAESLLNHPRPFFAPVAAVVCLGLSNTQRLRRMIELALGVTIGVGIAELLVKELGNGWWQISLVVLISMSVAQLLGGGALMTTQSAVQSIFLAALPQTPGGGLYRWEDALIGGTTALLVVAFLPAHPGRFVRQEAQGLIRELAAISSESAAVLRSGDAERADAVLDRARATQDDIQSWTDALRGGEEISRISPLRRRHVPELMRYRRGLVGLDRATRNLRVAVRRIAAALDTGAGMPAELADIFDHLAEILHLLEGEVGSAQERMVSTTALATLAGRLDPEQLGAQSLSANVVVAQIRSVVVDLLGATGMDEQQARTLLPD
ncbi:FUSC family protein [Kineosporia sp. J2-2]|uniref:FUSC family protein n=1 Tax=Kineosporia corallincola TaxID=2835133 RepID=A0ABS5TNK2_9ACTN|nr:FUSC family protein [Kineosporia corallincola]MBT0772682.1 FUSC family protein [Kineosporia corallincola]